VLKNAIKRRKPDFNETYYGFRAFGNLLEEAHARGLLEFGRDEKSGAYVYRSNAASTVGENVIEPGEAESTEHSYDAQVAEAVVVDTGGKHESRRRGRGNRKQGRGQQEAVHDERPDAEQTIDVQSDESERYEQEWSSSEPVFEHQQAESVASEASSFAQESGAIEPENAVAGPFSSGNEEHNEADGKPVERRKPRAPRKAAAKKAKKSTPRSIDDVPEIAAPAEPEPSADVEEAPVAAKKSARKTASRSRRPRKVATASDA
jgi:hypothetical protein